MAGPQKNDFNAWLQMQTMGAQSQSMTPFMSSQLAQQSAPESGATSMAPPEEYMTPIPPPQIVPVSTAAPKNRTAQPTNTAIGETPQEMIPQQPSMYEKKKLTLAEELDLSQQNYGENLALQQAEVDKMKEGLAKYAGSERGVDFTPLASLLDTWYGGNLTGAAKQMAPESASQKQKSLMDMQDKIAQAQGRMSQAEREGMQQRLTQLGYEEQRKSNKEIALINADARKTGAAQERIALQKQNLMDQNVQKLEKRIGDMAPGIISKYENLEKLIPGGIAGDNNLDVPGVGPGMFAVPDIFLSDNASEIQSVSRGLMADYLKLQSGTAASDKEVDRKLKEFGMTSSSKSSTYRSGLKRLKEQTIKEMKNKQAGFGEDVVSIYKSNGGLTDEDVSNIGKSRDGAGTGPGGKMSFDEWKKSQKKGQ